MSLRPSYLPRVELEKVSIQRDSCYSTRRDGDQREPQLRGGTSRDHGPRSQANKRNPYPDSEGSLERQAKTGIHLGA